jgi:hypothetical protein
MVKLWQESKATVSAATRPLMRGITKSLFLSLSEEERGQLLQDFLIIKDMDVPPEFIPRLVHRV